MRFEVYRTSDILQEEQPDPDAVYDEDQRVWTIEFGDLEELMEFIDTVGSCVVSGSDNYEGCIEIYDSYRE